MPAIDSLPPDDEAFEAFLRYVANQTYPAWRQEEHEYRSRILADLRATQLAIELHLHDRSHGAGNVRLADHFVSPPSARYSLAPVLQRGHSALRSSRSELEQSGYLDVLDRYYLDIAAGLEMRHLPSNEEEILRDAGFGDIADNMHGLLYLARRNASAPMRSLGREGVPGWYVPSKQLDRAIDELANTTKVLEQYVEEMSKEDRDKKPEEPTKKRKWFKGIGKILGGAGTCVANVGIAAASTAAPAAAPVGYTALSSCALGVTAIADGVGDLTGE